MKKGLTLIIMASLLVLGMVIPASAQKVPSISGLQAFSAATNFMSLPGYVRWQYFLENNIWLSWAEAENLVKSQLGK